MDALDTRMGSLEGRMNSLENRLEYVEAGLSEILQDLRSHRIRLEALETENKDLRQQIYILTQQLQVA